MELVKPIKLLFSIELIVVGFPRTHEAAWPKYYRMLGQPGKSQRIVTRKGASYRPLGFLSVYGLALISFCMSTNLLSYSSASS